MLFGAPQEISANVDLDGEAFRVVLPRPDGSTACLWALADAWWEMFPGSLPEGERDFWDDRLSDPDDPMSRSMLLPVAHQLANQVFGVPWWAAHRICEETAGQHMSWLAWCVKHGFEPSTSGAERLIASMVAFASEAWDDEAQAKSWSQKMFMRPKNARG